MRVSVCLSLFVYVCVSVCVCVGCGCVCGMYEPMRDVYDVWCVVVHVVVYGVECVVVYVLHVWLCMGLSVCL